MYCSYALCIALHSLTTEVVKVLSSMPSLTTKTLQDTVQTESIVGM